jgi:hypothetical protein
LEDKLVRVRFRYEFCYPDESIPEKASDWSWDWRGTDGDIIAYKVVG